MDNFCNEFEKSKLYEKITKEHDNTYIVSFIRKSLDTCVLLLYLTIESYKGNFPCEWICPIELKQIPQNKNSVIFIENFIIELKKKNYQKDLEYFENVSNNLYYLLKYLSISNTIRFIKVFKTDENKQESICIGYKVQNNNTTEDEFNNLYIKSNTMINYKYHGSKIQNWFSIITNGIKNYSNTNNMTTGASYGPGIFYQINIIFLIVIVLMVIRII